MLAEMGEWGKWWWGWSFGVMKSLEKFKEKFSFI